jgi:YfiH family protein
MNTPPHARHESLDRPSVTHGFFGREGGVSGGIFDSLNCGFGSGDAREAVAENRARVAAALGAKDLLTVYQTHSPHVEVVRTPWQPGAAPRADAMVSDQPGIALGILTADCAPVLFADTEAGVIGAAHAGWKGAFGGVLEATLDAMRTLGAEPARITAVIGPAISSASYEVGPEFYDRFIAEAADNARFFTASARAGHHLFDLPGYVGGRLKRAGVSRVADIAACTYAKEQTYFSYRRTTHRREADYGRNVSAILLNG